MNNESRLHAAFECEQLIAAYCQLIDHGRASETADLFTEDGVLTLSPGPWKGRETIRSHMKQRERMTQRISRHVCNNFLVTSVDSHTVTATTYLTLYRADVGQGEKIGQISGPVALGEYEDTFVRTEEGWLFSQRSCRIDLQAVD
ncbi:nuclear transport factor 2 family protein [Candidatus Bipolaricaulota bacterium]